MRNLHNKPKKHGFNRGFLVITLVLVVLGLLAIADASAPQALNQFNDKFYFIKQQLVWTGLGLIMMLVVSRIPTVFWEKMAIPFFTVSVILLLVVLFPGVGFKTLGARRWIALGPFSFQPSELIKLALAIFLAKLSSKSNSIYLFIPVVVIAGLIMLQPDLGTTIIVASTAMSVLFLSGINIFYFLSAFILGGVASLGLILTSTYRRARLLTFFQHSQDPLGSDYHIRQVLLALGSGGFFGNGIGQGKQKFLFLPEAATDSIFATIGEEVGFFGSFIVITLLFVFIWRAFRIAKNATNKFSYLLGMGICTWFGVQVLLNIGSMVALVPLTGVPLPFFSYGGSSLIMLFVGTGILLSIERETKHG